LRGKTVAGFFVGKGSLTRDGVYQLEVDVARGEHKRMPSQSKSVAGWWTLIPPWTYSSRDSIVSCSP